MCPRWMLVDKPKEELVRNYHIPQPLHEFDELVKNIIFLTTILSNYESIIVW
jgi:hypothetical protein